MFRITGMPIIAMLFGFFLSASGQATASEGGVCTLISGMEIGGVKITDSQIIEGSQSLPEYCRIQGVITPSIGFEARFPTEGWNGKYYQSGCGGFCGVVVPDKPGFSNSINEALKKGYAAITTDGGHQSRSMGDAWAYDDVAAEEVYAHSGVYLVRKAGARLVEAYYSHDPSRAYFAGCSNGGRMAAMTAQRYPDLFDGILAGGGVLNLSASGGLYGSWIVGSNMDADGNLILTSSFAPKLRMLTAEAVKQCDAMDGARDGIISAPRQCSMDVSQIRACGQEGGADCLTSVEAQVVSKWYQGPRNSKGEQLFPGIPPGSERYWVVWFLAQPNRQAVGNLLGGLYVKYLGLEQDPGDGYQVNDFDFDKDPARLVAKGKLYDATDPDLRAFEATGGKMIMYHGLADALVLPDNSIGYYNSVVDEMGGRAEIDDFFRFFTVPGMGHCWEMPAETPDQFDPIIALENWVERGIAPDYIPARSLNTAEGASKSAALCPYPATAVQYLEADADLSLVCAGQ